jgi:hypothetical protein
VRRSIVPPDAIAEWLSAREDICGNSNKHSRKYNVRRMRFTYVGRAAFQRLQKLLEDPAPSLEMRRQIGAAVEQLVPSTERRYRDGISQLAEELGPPNRYQELTYCRAFARVYDAEAVAALQVPNAATGWSFPWTIAKRLCGLPESERAELEKRCRAEEWSSTQLSRWVQRRRSAPASSGAPLKHPENVTAALEQLIATTEDWLKRAERLWFEPAEPALNADAIAAEGQNAIRLAVEAAEKLQRMRVLISRNLKMLTSIDGHHRESAVKKRRRHKGEAGRRVKGARGRKNARGSFRT